MPDFVKAQGGQFQLGGAPFPVTGFNCYFLAYCKDENRRAALCAARARGASVIRAWAFLAAEEFTPGGVAFQYFQEGRMAIQDGERGLERLDALIKAADDLGVKLILPLVNHWEALGGMATYVKWLAPGCEVTEFYRSSVVRRAYQDWVRAILTRRNTITGRLYSEEPAILAWELTNEARCQISGGHELLLDWVEEMADFVKSLDTNHLLALGDEGFFFQKGKGHLYDGRYGVDWSANLAVPGIDFGTYHFYPQEWGYGKKLNFGARWISDHTEAAAALNKPVILEEYGLKAAWEREQWYPKWEETIRLTGGAGSLVWMLGHQSDDTSGYVDDYVIY